jgi:hypothetical protein
MPRTGSSSTTTTTSNTTTSGLLAPKKALVRPKPGSLRSRHPNQQLPNKSPARENNYENDEDHTIRIQQQQQQRPPIQASSSTVQQGLPPAATSEVKDDKSRARMSSLPVPVVPGSLTRRPSQKLYQASKRNSNANGNVGSNGTIQSPDASWATAEDSASSLAFGGGRRTYYLRGLARSPVPPGEDAEEEDEGVEEEDCINLLSPLSPPLSSYSGLPTRSRAHQLAKTPTRRVAPPPAFLPSRSDLSYPSPSLRVKKTPRRAANGGGGGGLLSRKKRGQNADEAGGAGGGTAMRRASTSNGLEELLRSSLPPTAAALNQWGVLLADERETRAMDAELSLVSITPHGTANSRAAAVASAKKRMSSSKSRAAVKAMTSSMVGTRKRRKERFAMASGLESEQEEFEAGEAAEEARRELEESRQRLASLSAELEKERVAVEQLRAEMERSRRQKEAELEAAIDEAEAQTKAREEAEAFARSKVEEAEVAEKAREEEERRRSREEEARRAVERELKEHREREKREKKMEEERRRREEADREKRRKEEGEAARRRGAKGDADEGNSEWRDFREAIKREKRELRGDMDFLGTVLGSLNLFEQAVRRSMPASTEVVVAV